MDEQALWIVAVIGAGTLIGAFWKMKGGFGPMNLRIVGIVLIAVLSSVLAVAKAESLNAALGILGAIAGYLFGAKADGSEVSGVNTSDTSFGDNARVAGRDINETVNNLNARVQELAQLLSQDSSKIDHLVAIQEVSNAPKDYLINMVFERGSQSFSTSIKTVINRWESEGWAFKGMSSDFHGTDGMFLVFERLSERASADVQFFHGVEMSRV